MITANMEKSESSQMIDAGTIQQQAEIQSEMSVVERNKQQNGVEAFNLLTAGMNTYLSPEYKFLTTSCCNIEWSTPAAMGCDLASNVTAETFSFVRAYLVAYLHCLTKDTEIDLQSLLTIKIEQQASINIEYCRSLLTWLLQEKFSWMFQDTNSGRPWPADKGINVSTIVKDILLEYIKFAPGPWREAVFIECLAFTVLPRLEELLLQQQADLVAAAATTPHDSDRRNGENKASDAGDSRSSEINDPPHLRTSSSTTEGVDIQKGGPGDNSEGREAPPSESSSGGGDTRTESEADEDFSETQSIASTSSLMSENRFLARGLSTKPPSRGSHQRERERERGLGSSSTTAALVNKLKTEVAQLRGALERAGAADVFALQGRLRGAQADLGRVRDRNAELRERVQTLEGNLHSALERLRTAEAVRVCGGDGESRAVRAGGAGTTSGVSATGVNPNTANGDDEDGEFADALDGKMPVTIAGAQAQEGQGQGQGRGGSVPPSPRPTRSVGLMSRPEVEALALARARAAALEARVRLLEDALEEANADNASLKRGQQQHNMRWQKELRMRAPEEGTREGGWDEGGWVERDGLQGSEMDVRAEREAEGRGAPPTGVRSKGKGKVVVPSDLAQALSEVKGAVEAAMGEIAAGAGARAGAGGSAMEVAGSGPPDRALGGSQGQGPGRDVGGALDNLRAAVQRCVEQQRVADAKTIASLAEEVRRLSLRVRASPSGTRSQQQQRQQRGASALDDDDDDDKSEANNDEPEPGIETGTGTGTDNEEVVEEEGDEDDSLNGDHSSDAPVATSAGAREVAREGEEGEVDEVRDAGAGAGVLIARSEAARGSNAHNEEEGRAAPSRSPGRVDRDDHSTAPRDGGVGGGVQRRKKRFPPARVTFEDGVGGEGRDGGDGDVAGRNVSASSSSQSPVVAVRGARGEVRAKGQARGPRCFQACKWAVALLGALLLFLVLTVQEGGAAP